MRVLVCGGRDFGFTRSDRKVALDILRGLLEPGDEVIHGDAPGADRLAREAAIVLGLAHRGYPADWALHGKAAGPIRNRKMLDAERPEMVLAFPGGSGTADMRRQAKAAGVPVAAVELPTHYPVTPSFWRGIFRKDDVAAQAKRGRLFRACSWEKGRVDEMTHRPTCEDCRVYISNLARMGYLNRKAAA